jgi:hypothetical protein
VELSSEYLIEVFYTYCKRPFHKKYQNIFNAECPICKEGKSTGRQRRLFYFPNKNYFYCHNCARSWKPFDWVKEVTHLTVPEILKENSKHLQNPKKTSLKIYQHECLKANDFEKTNRDILPEGCVDLTDKTQIDYYKNNSIVQHAYVYCNKRRLFQAANACAKLYVSLDDKIHKNRLIIPFFSQENKIVSYQSRALFENQTPRYLTKFGEKPVFNINNIVADIPYVFVFEGPIDSMFVKNGVALAALSPTHKQLEQLKALIGYQLIFVFDNDKNNQQTQQRIKKHIKGGSHVFIWPNELSRYKDFNEICCSLDLNEISWNFIVKNSAFGPAALLKYNLCKN